MNYLNYDTINGLKKDMGQFVGKCVVVVMPEGAVPMQALIVANSLKMTSSDALRVYEALYVLSEEDQRICFEVDVLDKPL